MLQMRIVCAEDLNIEVLGGGESLTSQVGAPGRNKTIERGRLRGFWPTRNHHLPFP